MIPLLQKMVCVVWKIKDTYSKEEIYFEGFFQIPLRQMIFDLSLDKRT